MDHFPDLTLYTRMLPTPLSDVVSVGWLSEGPYVQGKVPEAFLKKLAALIARDQVNRVRSLIHCPICGDKGIWIEYGALKFFLGHSEVWVPSPNKKIIYAATSMIWHYICAHGYVPPSEFQDAILQFDLSSEWNGSREHNRRVQELFEKRT